VVEKSGVEGGWDFKVLVRTKFDDLVPSLLLENLSKFAVGGMPFRRFSCFAFVLESKDFLLFLVGKRAKRLALRQVIFVLMILSVIHGRWDENQTNS
jgi:hypothetical protein